MSNIVILKTITSDEVIAESVGEVGQYRAFKMPRQFITQPDGKGGQATGLVPYIILAPDSDVTFNMDLIAAVIPAPAEVEKAYLRATSKIALL